MNATAKIPNPSTQLTQLSHCIFGVSVKTPAQNHQNPGDYYGILDLMFPLVPGTQGERQPNEALIETLPFEGRHIFRNLMELIAGEEILGHDQRYNLMTELNLLRHSNVDIHEMMAEDMDAFLRAPITPAP